MNDNNLHLLIIIFLCVLFLAMVMEYQNNNKSDFEKCKISCQNVEKSLKCKPACIENFGECRNDGRMGQS